MKRICLTVLVLSLFFTIACNLGLSSSSAYYYIQQDKDDKKEVVGPTEDIEIKLNYMFDILKANGEIAQTELESLLQYYESELNSDEALLITFFEQLYQLPAFKYSIDSNFPIVDFDTFSFKDKVIRAEFSSKNVPSMVYSNEDSWVLSDDVIYLAPLEGDEVEYTFENIGPNTTAGVNAISEVAYYKYEGHNPFFSIDSKYNQAKLIDGSETGMKRFNFYRFVGKGGGVVNLDNMLVAVDTYTSLIFSYGVPTEFLSILGQDSPTKWEPVETAATAPDGKKYNFYEYDPAGYVDKDGNFVMENWYTENLSKANKANYTLFYPQFTGVSPYIINFDVVKPKVTISSGSDPDGYYTEISPSFDALSDVFEYKLYRLDDSKTERRLIATQHYNETYKDYNALILTKYPSYMVEAVDKNGNTLGSPTSFIEGQRDLTEREILLAAMESVRYALIDEGLHSLFTTNKTIQGANGGTFTYLRKGLFSQNYTFTMDNFKPYFLTLHTETGQEVTFSSKEILSIKTNDPFTGEINLKDNFTKSIIFADIVIEDNNKDSPNWTSGTLNIDTNSYLNNGINSIPFALFMSRDAYRGFLLDSEGNYIQK